MRGIKKLLLWGMLILVMYTFFYMQNRVFVPVRFTFNYPVLFSLPLLMLFSFMGGLFFSAVLFLFYRVPFAKSTGSVYLSAIAENNGKIKLPAEEKKEDIPELLEYTDNTECADCKRDLEKLFFFGVENIFTYPSRSGAGAIGKFISADGETVCCYGGSAVTSAGVQESDRSNETGGL